MLREGLDGVAYRAHGRFRVTLATAITLGLASAFVAWSPTVPQAAVLRASLQSCHVTGSGEYVLPDPSCSPGAVDHAFTKAMLCRGDEPRPSEGLIEQQKREDIARYGDYAGTAAGPYEEDHVVPLELGGAPLSMANRYPEYDNGVIPNPKDRVEDAARALSVTARCLSRQPRRRSCPTGSPLASSLASRPQIRRWSRSGPSLARAATRMSTTGPSVSAPDQRR
jgi:hypothetical protein